MSYDKDYLRSIIRNCEVATIPAGTVLYRGSFEGWPNEFPEDRVIAGVKTFAFRREVALAYASRDCGVNPFPGRIPADSTLRPVVFELVLDQPCLAFIWPNPGFHYAAASDLGFQDVFEFERNELLPLVRTCTGTPGIAGYVTNRDTSIAGEAVLDTGVLVASAEVTFVTGLPR